MVRSDCEPASFEIEKKDQDGLYNCLALSERCGHLFILGAEWSGPVDNRLVISVLFFLMKFTSYFLVTSNGIG